MIAEVEATSWRLRECIRVRELAATHRFERMRRLRMLEEQEAWKREAGFDQIEIIAEMREQHCLAGFDSKPLYSKVYNSRWPHFPEEHKLDMDVEIERLRLEILLSQLAPSPQDGLSPRGSPVVGTGLDEPGGSRAEMQSTEREGIVALQASLDVCTSPEQGTAILLQADVEVDDDKTTTAQAAAREEFGRQPKNRQKRRVASWSAEQTKQFDPGV